MGEERRQGQGEDDAHRPTIPPYDRASTILVVEPNPIELPTTAGSLVVKMRPYLAPGSEIPITAVEITEVTVTGAGLSLTGMTCVSGDSLPCRVCTDSVESCLSAASVTLVRDPLVTPSDGELRVTSNDLEGHDYTLIVPILAP